MSRETEQERRAWETETDPVALLRCPLIRGRSRKLRLFACSNVRSVEKWMVDQQSVRMIEYAEHFADGKLSAEVLALAGLKAQLAIRRWPLVERAFVDWVPVSREGVRHPQTALQQLRYRVPAQLAAMLGRIDAPSPSMDTFTLPRCYWPSEPEVVKNLPQLIDLFLTRWPAEDVLSQYVAVLVPLHAYFSAFSRGGNEALEAFRRERCRTVRLVRDVFGDPFRPCIIDSAWLRWRDGTVPRIAAGIYEQHRFDEMPILADALEEAGCTNAELLDHCRVAAEHVRGCWVVDLVRSVA